MSWWWCLEHNRVEEGKGCANMNRLGPYETQELAATALDRAHERTAERDAQEAAEDPWKDDWGR